VFLRPEGTDFLRFATGFGEDIVRLRSIDITIVEGAAEGEGVCGQAFRARDVVVANDFLNDQRSVAWREGAVKAEVGAVAAVPLRRGGHSIGIMLVTRREPNSLTDETISMLKRMSANICFALDNLSMRPRARKPNARCAG